MESVWDLDLVARFCCYFYRNRWYSPIHFTDLNLKWEDTFESVVIVIVVVSIVFHWRCMAIKIETIEHTVSAFELGFFIPYHCHFKIISMRELCCCSVFDVFAHCVCCYCSLFLTVFTQIQTDINTHAYTLLLAHTNCLIFSVFTS